MPTRFVSLVLAAAIGIAAVSLPARATTHGTDDTARFAAILAAEGSRLPEAARRDLARRLLLLASYYRLDARLLVALVSSESAWEPHAVSPVGARGLGQLMPGTARSLDVDALETYENLDGTARYLRRMIDRASATSLRERYRLALASYNAGPYAVKRYGGIPPYAETRNYVAIVMARYDAFCRAVPSLGPPPLIAELPPAAAPSRTAQPARRVAPSAVPRPAPTTDVVTVLVHPARIVLALAPIPAFTPRPGPIVAYQPKATLVPTAFSRFHQLRGDNEAATPSPVAEPTSEAEPEPTADPTTAPTGTLEVRVPHRITAGDPILVDILNAGTAPVTVIETLGGREIDRWPDAYGRHLILKSPEGYNGSNVVVVKAYGPGNIVASASLIADPARPK